MCACPHGYTDDTQQYVSTEMNDAAAADFLTSCLLAINKWMTDSFIPVKQGQN